MTVTLIGLLAILEIVIGAGVFASSKSSIHEVLGINIIGFGILTLGFAGLQSELRHARQEADKERQGAEEERQARAAADLTRRTGIIASIDRRPAQTGNAALTSGVMSGAVSSSFTGEDGPQPPASDLDRDASDLERALDRLSREINSFEDDSAQDTGGFRAMRR